jgi:hypothetical protein
MHKQRLGILIAASVGILISFLPSYSMDGENINAQTWLILVLFSIPLIISLIGKNGEPLSKRMFIVTIISGAVVILLGVFNIWYISSLNKMYKMTEREMQVFKNLDIPISNTEINIEFGLYFMILAAIALVIVSIKTKEKFIHNNNKPQELNLMSSKRCPYCAETINKDAKKCKFCGEFLDDDLRRDKEIYTLK